MNTYIDTLQTRYTIIKTFWRFSLFLLVTYGILKLSSYFLGFVPIKNVEIFFYQRVLSSNLCNNSYTGTREQNTVYGQK